MSRARLQAALEAARDTKHLELGRGAMTRTSEVFAAQFQNRKPVVVSDKNTWRVAGEQISAALHCRKLVFDDPNLYAEHGFVEQLQAQLATTDAIPVAVGSGTINDITKLAESDAFLIEKGREIRSHGLLYQTLPYGGNTKEIYWKLLDLGLMSFATDHPDVTWDAVKSYYAEGK